MTKPIRGVGFGGPLATILLAARASAHRVHFQTNYAGQALGIRDTISVTVLFDTEGPGNVMLLGVGITFDSTILEQVPGSSSTPTCLLYATTKNAYLVPASTCAPVCGLSTVPGVNDQDQLDFLSSKVARNIAVPGTTAGSFGRFGHESLGTCVFHVKAPVLDFGQLAFSFAGARGGILQLGPGSQVPLALGAPLSRLTPEPSTACSSASGSPVWSSRAGPARLRGIRSPSSPRSPRNLHPRPSDEWAVPSAESLRHGLSVSSDDLRPHRRIHATHSRGNSLGSYGNGVEPLRS